MLAESFRNASHFVKFMFVLFTILVGLVIFMVLGLVIAIPLFGVDLAAFSEALDPAKHENINLLKFLQSVYSIGLFAFPPVIVAWFFSSNVWQYLRLRNTPNTLLIILSAIIVVVSFPLVNFLIELNQNIRFPEAMQGFEELMKQLENDAQSATKAFLTTNSFSVYLINLLVLAVIPALGEELLFRGVFQRIFHEWWKNIHIAVWVSAFLFSAMHMQFYGLIPRLVLGAFLGYLFYWSGSLWLPIITHFLNNAFAVTAFYLNGNIAEEAETIGTGEGATLQVLISILLVSVLIYSFYRISKEKNLKLGLSNINEEPNEQNS